LQDAISSMQQLLHVYVLNGIDFSSTDYSQMWLNAQFFCIPRAGRVVMVLQNAQHTDVALTGYTENSSNRCRQAGFAPLKFAAQKHVEFSVIQQLDFCFI
jgi:hypothetical protein